MKKLIEKAADKFNTDKKTAVIILIGIAGVILLVISEIIPLSASEEKHNERNETQTVSCSDYEKEVEQRLQGIISKIEGAGNVSVMVTLESTVESVYAQEEKQSGGENKNYENQYVIIKTNDGEGGILLKTTEPQIRGVAIVCTGGNSAVVRQNITNTVTAVLGISSARVNITAMKKDNGG